MGTNQMIIEFEIKTKYGYHPERREWVGQVIQTIEGVQTVRDVGMENTEALILEWCKKAQEAYLEDPLNDHTIPDMYDRKVTQ